MTTYTRNRSILHAQVIGVLARLTQIADAHKNVEFMIVEHCARRSIEYEIKLWLHEHYPLDIVKSMFRCAKFPWMSQLASKCFRDMSERSRSENFLGTQ